MARIYTHTGNIQKRAASIFLGFSEYKRIHFRVLFSILLCSRENKVEKGGGEDVNGGLIAWI
jgi:hypothetical protein